MKSGISYLARTVLSFLLLAHFADSCTYRQDIASLNEELSRLQALADEVNKSAESLSALVEASLRSDDWVTSIEPVSEGDIVTGTMIYFLHRDPVFISNGKKGPKGDDAQDGKDGADAQAPSIGLKQDADGLWYWTLDGEWLLDDKGHKVQARGTDGVCPIIKAESGKWWVSYDGGATWKEVGDVTQYEKSYPNYASVEIIDGATCVVTLNNGQKIYLPLWVDFDVRFIYGTTYYLAEGNEISVSAVVEPYVELDISSVCDGDISISGIEQSADYDGVRICFKAAQPFSSGAASLVFEKRGKLVYKRLLFKKFDGSDSSVTDVVISEESLNLALGCTHYLYAYVRPLNPTYGNIVWSSTNPDVATVSSYGLVSAKASGSCSIKATAHNGKYACCSVTVGSRNAVDLGLSVNWAESNIGASSAFDSGIYFAWGETAGKPDEGPQVYDWSTYAFCAGTSTSLTKYNTNASYGNVDGLTALLSYDDAASTWWGDTWRMPTASEWAELYDYCTWEYLSKGQVSDKVSGFIAEQAGYLVIKGGVGGKSLDAGKHIFLPAAGCFSGNFVEDAGLCHYWSSSLYQDHPDCALEFLAGPSGFKPQYGTYRCYGLPVRSVIP